MENNKTIWKELEGCTVNLVFRMKQQYKDILNATVLRDDNTHLLIQHDGIKLGLLKTRILNYMIIEKKD